MASPLLLIENTVESAWVDYNGHMNDAAYAGVFSQATDALLGWLGLDATFREARRYTVYTLEVHIRYLREAHDGQRLATDAWLVDHDTKRLHVVMTLRRSGDDALLATGEQMLMGIDTSTVRPADFPPAVAERVQAFWQRHGGAGEPESVRLSMGIRRRS